jgi:hypothetical protein
MAIDPDVIATSSDEHDARVSGSKVVLRLFGSRDPPAGLHIRTGQAPSLEPIPAESTQLCGRHRTVGA